jgi:hypothetical protein
MMRENRLLFLQFFGFSGKLATKQHLRDRIATYNIVPQPQLYGN